MRTIFGVTSVTDPLYGNEYENFSLEVICQPNRGIAPGSKRAIRRISGHTGILFIKSGGEP